MINVLTVDVEDWYQVEIDSQVEISKRVLDNTNRLLAILSETGTKATFFIQGLVAEKFPQLIKKIHKEGHEVATHGYDHKQVFRQNRKEFEWNLKRSITVLEDLIQEKILGYRAPDYSIIKDSTWALNVLEEQGLQYDSSIFPIKGRRYGIPNAPRFPYRIPGTKLIEIPLSTIRLFGVNLPVCGGGYMRVSPYWLTKLAIKKINGEGKPAILYTHPHELDTEELKDMGRQKSIPLSVRLSQGLNRGKTEYKVRNLCSDFRLGPIREVVIPLLHGGS